MSNKKLKNSNVAKISDVEFMFEPLGIHSPAYANIELPSLLQSLKGNSYSTASDAFMQANRHIWNSLDMKAKKQYVPLDSRFVSDIIIENINDSESIIHDMLFTENGRKDFLQAQYNNIYSPENLVVQDTSNFFHLQKGESLVPLKLAGNELDIFVDARTNKSVGLLCEPEPIVKLLSERKLYADLVLEYTFLELLPDIQAYGGTNQKEYLPVIHTMVEDYLQSSNYAEVLPRFHKQQNGVLIGPSLLELNQEQQRMIQGLNRYTDLDAFENTFSSLSLDESMGNLSAYEYFDFLYERRITREHDKSFIQQEQ